MMSALSANKISEKIKNIFEQTLGFPVENLDENFFMLGGNSMQALEIINLLNNEFNANLTIMDFFERLTISKMSQMMTSIMSA